MEVSCQLHVLGALSNEDPPVPIGYEVGWAPEPVWTRRWRQKKPHDCPCRELNTHRPVRGLLPIPPELHRLPGWFSPLLIIHYIRRKFWGLQSHVGKWHTIDSLLVLLQVSSIGISWCASPPLYLAVTLMYQA